MAWSLRSPAFPSRAAISGAPSRSRSCFLRISRTAWSTSTSSAATSSAPTLKIYGGRGRRCCRWLAVGIFFWLGYQYLETSDVGAGRAAPAPGGPGAAEEAGVEGTRNWFDPREGLAMMRMPLDYAIMVVLGIGNFILSFVGYWRPNGSSCWAEAGLARCGIFDETYFARAGEEYLQNLRIYENTHPPLSKLLITFSMMLFGGMPKGHGLGGWTFLNGMIGHMCNGDNPYGWRFLDLVFGALVVMLLYCFAKRVTGSTLFATTTALLLTFDGMHFVQSRTATPEGFVIFFATLAVYAFYRFWISSQVGERGHVVVPWWAFAGAVAAALAIGAAIGQICRDLLGFRRCGHVGRHALRDVPRLFARALSRRAPGSSGTAAAS